MSGLDIDESLPGDELEEAVEEELKKLGYLK